MIRGAEWLWQVDQTCIVIRHDFHSSFWSIFDPTYSLSLLIPFSFLMFISLCFIMLTTRWQGHNSTGIGTTTYFRHQLSDCHMITWLCCTQKSPSHLQPSNPVLEPPPQSSLLPTAQSSGLPKHGVRVGVHQLCEDPNWLQGSSEVLQQDLPDLEPPFKELHSWTFQGMSLFQLEQGRSVHQPPGSQWHHPTGSL